MMLEYEFLVEAEEIVLAPEAKPSRKTKNDPLAKVVRAICSSKAVLVGATGFEPVTSSV